LISRLGVEGVEALAAAALDGDEAAATPSILVVVPAEVDVVEVEVNVDVTPGDGVVVWCW
jgi:hypothetical protein